MTPSERDYENEDEVRLGDYLKELNEDPPESDPHLSRRVGRRARWQQAARGPLQAIGMLFAALADGLSELLGANRSSRR